MTARRARGAGAASPRSWSLRLRHARRQRGAGAGRSARSLAGWQALVEGPAAPTRRRLFDRRLRAAPARSDRAVRAREHRLRTGRARGGDRRLRGGAGRAARAPDDVWRCAAAGARRRRPRAHALRRGRRGDAPAGSSSGWRPRSSRATADLPWLARVELVRLAAHAAREAGDAAELARVAQRVGCAAQVFDLGRDRAARERRPRRAGAALRGRPPRRRGAPSTASGCRLDVAVDRRRAGRGAAAAHGVRGAPRATMTSCSTTPARRGCRDRRRRAGGARRGDALRPPHLSAVRVQLPAGRHDIELRIATRAASPASRSPCSGGRGRRRGRPTSDVRYVDPRAPAPRHAPASSSASPARRADAANAARRWPTTARRRHRPAPRRPTSALVLAARLRARPRFALGLALAARSRTTIRRGPPASPATRRGARCAPRSPSTPSLARAWHDLAALALEDERPRDAIEAGRAAARAAPGLVGAAAAAGARVHGARAGLRRQPRGRGARRARPDRPRAPRRRCRAGDRGAARAGAQERRALAARGAPGGGAGRVRRQRRGARRSAAGARRAVARRAAAAARGAAAGTRSATTWRAIWRACWSAEGGHDDALAEMAALVARDPQRSAAPRAARRRAGGRRAARRPRARRSPALLAARPDVPEVQRAARALGVPLPLDGFRVDGRAIIRAFEAAAARYTAPAVMVLDRAVMRIFPGGTVMTLTHQIVRVDSKDAVDKLGRGRGAAGRRDPDPAHAQARRLDARARGDRGQGGDLGGRRRDRRLHRVGVPGDAAAVAGVRARLPGRPVLLPVVRRADGAQRAGAGVAAGDRAGAGSRAPARPSRRRAPRSTARASRASWRWACRSCSRSAPRCPRSNTCRRCARRAGVDWRRWARYLGEELHDARALVARRCASRRAQLAEAGARAVGGRWPRRWSTG